MKSLNEVKTKTLCEFLKIRGKFCVIGLLGKGAVTVYPDGSQLEEALELFKDNWILKTERGVELARKLSGVVVFSDFLLDSFGV